MCAYIAHFAYNKVTETLRSHGSPTNKCDRASSMFPNGQLFIFVLDYAKIFMSYPWHINALKGFYNV